MLERLVVTLVWACFTIFALAGANLPEASSTIQLGGGRGESQAFTMPGANVGPSGIRITLLAGDYFNTLDGNHAYPFRQVAGPSGVAIGTLYQVPVGSSLHCYETCQVGPDATSYWTRLSGTATFANDTALGSVTGIAYATGTSGAFEYGPVSAAQTWNCDNIEFVWPSGVWPGVMAQGSFHIVMRESCVQTTP